MTSSLHGNDAGKTSPGTLTKFYSMGKQGYRWREPAPSPFQELGRMAVLGRDKDEHVM